MDLPRGYISYNQIRLYQSCPKKYYYSYIEKIPTIINDKIFLGIVIHSVFESYLKKKIEGILLTNEEIKELFSQTFSKLEKEMDITWQTPAEEARRRGIGFVRYFENTIAPSLKPLMIEKEMEIDIPEMDIKIRGIIDLVEEDFSITDFKTTTTKWSPSKVQNGFLQMVIYKYLFEEQFGGVISELKFLIIHSKGPSNIKHQELSMKSEEADTKKMLDVIRYVVQNIQKGMFYKNESYICGFCEYKNICRKSTS